MEVIKLTEENTPSAALKKSYGEHFSKLSRADKLFLIHMIAALLCAAEAEKINENVSSGVSYIHRFFNTSEKESLILKLVNSL